ncbi:hypothetical protein BDW22DRAFT_565542 [Trametopsis cervina]|nr:hypothetical protein BDW22DRAFT_565542 [Trametopsis cervina]
MSYSAESQIAALVREFNSLPFRPLVPSGYGPNKWIFGLHFVPLPPPGMLLSFVNPFSRYVHCEGPLPVDNRPLTVQTLQERGQQIAILLLKAFVSGLGVPDSPPQLRFAPWEWAVEDPSLSAAVSNALIRLGVRSELCVVGVADLEERRIAIETHQELLKTMVQSARAVAVAGY